MLPPPDEPGGCTASPSTNIQDVYSQNDPAVGDVLAYRQLGKESDGNEEVKGEDVAITDTDTDRHRDFLVKLTHLLHGGASAIVSPFLPVFLKNVLGLSTGQIGIVSAGKFFYSAVITSWMCAAVDKAGCVVAGLLISVSSSICLRGSLFFSPRALVWLKGGSSISSLGIFWLLWIYIGLAEGIHSTSYVMLDTVTMTRIESEKYGEYRVWAGIGWAATAFAMGFVFEILPLQYMFSLFAGVMSFVVLIWGCAPPPPLLLGAQSSKPLLINGDEAEEHGQISKERKGDDDDSFRYDDDIDEKELLQQPRRSSVQQHANTGDDRRGARIASSTYFEKIVRFFRSLDAEAIETLIVVVPMGVAAGAMNALLFVYLQQLGASTVLLGTTLVVNIMTEIPCFVYSEALRKRFGIRCIIYIGVTAYAVRVGWYAWIQNPWLVMPAELLHGVTFALVWSSLAVLATQISPEKGLQATTQGLFSLLFNGVGGGIGAVGGGYLYESIGPRKVFAGISLCNVAALLLLVITDCRRAMLS